MGWLVLLLLVGGAVTTVDRGLGPLGEGGVGPALVVACAVAMCLGMGVAFLGEMLGTTEPINKIALAVAGVETPSDAVYECADPPNEKIEYLLVILAGFPLVLFGGMAVTGGLAVIPLALIGVVLTGAWGLFAGDLDWVATAGKWLAGGAVAVLLGALAFRGLHALGEWGCFL